MTDTFRPTFAGALLLVALADFLFFGRAIGISLLIFCTAIAAATLILHPAAARGRAHMAFCRSQVKQSGASGALTPVAGRRVGVVQGVQIAHEVLQPFFEDMRVDLRG